MNVSIAMATYNGGIHLKEQLNSFLTQTKLPDEVIISDDNSNDSTLEIIKEFKQKASFKIKIFESERRLGFIKNFEKAITKTTGDIIFLSDQDDVWFSNKIETITNLFSCKLHPLVVINDQEIVENNLTPSGVTRLQQLEKIGYSDLKFKTGCCTAFHSSLKPLIIPIPDKYISHDVWIHKVAHYLKRRHVLREVLQYYRRHQENASNGLMKQSTLIDPKSFYIRSLRKKVSNYDKEIIILEELKRRMTDSYENSSFKNLIDSIDKEISAWKKRNKLNSHTFLRKRIMMFKMLLNGDYDVFNGYKSFLKDFIT